MLGERLGKWVIYRELGRGGMGRVFLAQEELQGRMAAIKILAAELAQEVGFLQRFQREIDTLRQLDHPGIVKFYESGYENDFYYYAMEYVEGQSLEEILEREKQLPWPEVLEIATKVCPALKHAHDHGVIHRDIKPGNLLRTITGSMKLTDFGIAKVFAGGHLTATGGIVGTAEFLSPEQASGKPVNKRSDLYSLGVVLYMLITGKPPFEGNTTLDLLHKHCYAQFDRPQKIVPEIPYELDEVVCQLLEKDPAKRPADARVLGTLLEKIKKKMDRKGRATEEIIPSEQTLAENAMVAHKPEVEGPATLMSRLVREELEEQKRGNFLTRLFNNPIVLVVSLALCIGILVWTFWPMSQETLFARGKELMASQSLINKERAWSEYLQPLNENYPGHPYQDEVEELRLQLVEAREARENPWPSEAKRLYKLAEQLRKEGDHQKAKQTCENLVTAFSGLSNEDLWVGKAQELLDKLKEAEKGRKSLKSVDTAIKTAKQESNRGKQQEAEKRLQALEALYRGSALEQEVLTKIADARREIQAQAKLATDGK